MGVGGGISSAGRVVAHRRSRSDRSRRRLGDEPDGSRHRQLVAGGGRDNRLLVSDGAQVVSYAGSIGDFFPDTTNTAHPGTTIGYGGPGSPNTNNRAIQQVTFDWVQTLWRDRRYGALQTYAQYSYLTRAPWFVAPDNPKNAHLSMVYAGFRYVLPSTAGTLLRVPYPN